MKNKFEQPVSQEEGTRLFEKMKRAAQGLPEEVPEPNTGAGAMHEWEVEKAEREEKKMAA